MSGADAESDLDPALRARIDDLCAKLHDIDHYALLGVPRGADKKTIKSAYFQSAAQLHPDRYFGKRLGPWKQKMEQLFARLSLAHEVLTHAAQRPEYDAYLRERDHTLALERALEVDEAMEPAEERPIDPGAIRSATPGPRPAVQVPTASQAPSPDAERARREALARKLAGGSSRRMGAVRPPSTPSMNAVAPKPNPSPAPSRPLPTSPNPAPSWPMPTSANPTPSRPLPTGPAPARPSPTGVEALVSAARTALSLGDIANASHKMRLAAHMDPRYAAEADALAKRVYAEMAAGYEKQAQYEEHENRWIDAAISWSKALEGRPEEGRYAERAANALRRGGGDLHKAASLAETAVRLRPNDARAQVTLAWVYLDAGLIRRAKTVIETALRLAPSDVDAREVARLIAVKT